MSYDTSKHSEFIAPRNVDLKHFFLNYMATILASSPLKLNRFHTTVIIIYASDSFYIRNILNTMMNLTNEESI